MLAPGFSFFKCNIQNRVIVVVIVVIVSFACIGRRVLPWYVCECGSAASVDLLHRRMVWGWKRLASYSNHLIHVGSAALRTGALLLLPRDAVTVLNVPWVPGNWGLDSSDTDRTHVRTRT